MAKRQDPATAAPVLLIVDDDAAVRGSLKFALEIEGYNVRTYAGARELLEASDLPAAGCLIIDQYMPAMSGLDLLTELRSRHVSLPALLITSDPPPLVRQRAAEAGASIIEKPLLGNALLDAIAKAIAPKTDRQLEGETFLRRGASPAS